MPLCATHRLFSGQGPQGLADAAQELRRPEREDLRTGDLAALRPGVLWAEKGSQRLPALPSHGRLPRARVSECESPEDGIVPCPPCHLQILLEPQSGGFQEMGKVPAGSGTPGPGSAGHLWALCVCRFLRPVFQLMQGLVFVQRWAVRGSAFYTTEQFQQLGPGEPFPRATTYRHARGARTAA